MIPKVPERDLGSRRFSYGRCHQGSRFVYSHLITAVTSTRTTRTPLTTCTCWRAMSTFLQTNLLPDKDKLMHQLSWVKQLRCRQRRSCIIWFRSSDYKLQVSEAYTIGNSLYNDCYFCVDYVHTAKNVADIVTKAVALEPLFKFHAILVMSKLSTKFNL